MRITRFAEEGMRELYEPADLAEALREARARSLALYAHLEGDDWEFPYLESVNPPQWELAHIAWFQDFWCLRYREDDPAGERVPPLLADADRCYDSRIVPHADRWEIARAPRGPVYSYLEDSLDAALEALERSDADRRYYFRLALLHEDMHGEALLMTLQNLGLPAPPLDAAEPPPGPAVAARDVAFAECRFIQGTKPGGRDFTFDNEREAHEVRVAPFAIADRPVTQGEFAAFVEEGGYRRDEFWRAEGREWRDRCAAAMPVYWRRAGSGFESRRFDAWGPLDASAPVVNVTTHEAEAWCRWAKRRLPTETEWECAARNAGRDERFPWGDRPAERPATLDYRHSGPSLALSDPAPVPTGLRQMLGGVWEWTASPFAPYAGFRPGPYREYSEPWFHDHRVLRGGSFATRSRLVHNRWRNFYRPHRGDAFAGFRTCAVVR
jgi:iron(II)-dependent oxidoreductase